MKYSLIISAVIIIIYLASIRNKNEQVQEEIKYKIREILTPNEKKNFAILKPIAYDLDLHIFVKVRLADIIEHIDKEDYSAFNKIKAKHIDFVLCDYDLNIIACIELQDKSHEREDRKERDIFVRESLEECDIMLIESYNFKKTNIRHMLEQAKKDVYERN